MGEKDKDNFRKIQLSLIFIVCFFPLLRTSSQEGTNSQISLPKQFSMSALPIAMFDSDIGFGFGAKGVLKNIHKKNESYDIILFGSTKGEQWYALAFSIPDFEFRHRKRFKWALDFKIEFDKFLKSNYFGIGNNTKDNKNQFPRELTRIQFALSRGFTEKLVGEIGLRFSHHSVYGYDQSWNTISNDTPGTGETDIIAASIMIKYDNRDNWLDPSSGMKIESRFEKAIKAFSDNNDFSKIRIEANSYNRIFSKNHVVALRLWIQDINGDTPYQELSKIGDGWTARGYKADRFLDKAMALTSIEYRAHLYKRLGGVLFVDAGRVWPNLSHFNFSNWHSNWGVGLRYSTANFLVRLDTGFSGEGMRIFFNFGQVF